MAGTSKAHRLAKTLLAKENIGIAKEIADAHLVDAMKKGDRVRVRELSGVIDLIEEVETGDSTDAGDEE